MAKTGTERQMNFRANRKAEGGMRLDMWLPPEEAEKLKRLMVWNARSAPQVFLELLHNMWMVKVEIAAQYRCYADAQFEYASFYARKCALGQGTTRESIEAEKWFLESEQQGYRVSAGDNNLGMLALISGNEKKAVKWFQLSADRGNRVALYNLGLLGLEGRAVHKSYWQVAEWFLKSAEQGFSLAQEIVGILYAIGKGVSQNQDTALEWLRRARGEDVLACENFLARMLSTSPLDQYGIRNGEVAVTIAERLVRSNESTDYLNTLAAAYAEAKRFDEAIKTQKKVRLKLQRGRPSKQRDSVLLGCTRRLTSYMDKKSWRDAALSFLYCWDFGDHEVRVEVSPAWAIANLIHF